MMRDIIIVHTTHWGGNISGKKSKEPIFALDILNNRLIAARQNDQYNIGVFDVRTGEDIVRVNKPDGFRSGSLDIAVTHKGDIFVACEHIAKIPCGLTGTIPLSDIKLTHKKADFVYLATDGDKVLATYYSNPDVHKDGQEFLMVCPKIKRVAFCDSRVNNHKYLTDLTLSDNTITFIEYNLHKNNNVADVVQFKLTDEMLRSKNGIKAKPRKILSLGPNDLLNNTYGGGNAIITVPFDDLECIIAYATQPKRENPLHI